MKRLLIVLAILFAIGAAILGYAILEARRDPLVHEARITLPDWPKDAPPMRVVLISDIHIGTMAMGPARLTRIVGQINALNPDLVLIAGDFIFGHEKNSAGRLGAPMVAPLAGLRARLGVIATLGNHDHWTGGAAVHALLIEAGITVLENQAVQRGPLVIGGIGDEYSRQANLPATLAAVAKLPGARIMLTHSPDIAPELPANVSLLLAGHTHCGQVFVPALGLVSDISRFGARYRCGIRREGARTVVTTAGLGTSGPPVRLGAPPDLWLLTLGG